MSLCVCVFFFVFILRGRTPCTVMRMRIGGSSEENVR